MLKIPLRPTGAALAVDVQAGFPPSLFEKLCDRCPGDAFLQNALPQGIAASSRGMGTPVFRSAS